ncbi:hypothetical protein RRG08_032712 [Elysia crispata]|uniref:Methyltransferase type 11 domain-containing protein n=1 Tax=Elysia crispata TaxID=231223 RepID=A0AAE1D5H3_9GAST|nr:hypothetical protein RRG08_032712 [Elysia crispata]
MCKTLGEFKIKNLKGGFQRRPELICQRITPVKCSSQAGGSNVRNTKVERIQYELVTASLKLLHSVDFVDKVTKVSPYLKFPSHEPFYHGGEEQHAASKALPLTLDIGCGVGYSLKPLIAIGYPCIGVDLDLSSLQQTKTDLLHPVFRNHFKSSAMDLLTEAKLDKKYVQVFNSAYSQQHNNILKKEAIECDSYRNRYHDCLRIQPNLDGPSMSSVLKPSTPVADVVRWDLKHGLPFKPSSFDLAISISFLQWLFYGNTEKQLHSFFASLKSILYPKGRAIIQFYPQNMTHLEKAVRHAMPYFHGIVVGDYPHLDRVHSNRNSAVTKDDANYEAGFFNR